MSEYQYYEFVAIDRPLTGQQMAELRACSTRARITATSFANEYQWGSFKGDEDVWMERYFDAFLHVANWGTNLLMLRLPAAVLPAKVAKPYCARGGLTVRAKAGCTILTFCSEDESGDEESTGEGLLGTLVPLRADLANGDLRALYLAWLVGVQDGSVDDDRLEPAVPAGLADLTGPLEALVEFLRIDSSLVAAAAQRSAAPVPTKLARSAVTTWLRDLPAKDKDRLLARVVTGDAQSAADQMRRGIAAASGSKVPKVPRVAERRSAGALRRAAHRLGAVGP